MKKTVMLLLCVSSGVFAEPRVLPPVIDNSSYPAGAASIPSAPSNHAIYEVLGRLEQLQSEVQQLRGVVEEQSQTILDLKNRQGNIYSDFDQRIQELAGVDVSIKPSQQGVNSPVMTEVTKEPMGLENTAPAMNSPMVVRDSPENVIKQGDLYQAAYETLRNGHNAKAIVALKSFLVEFPNGEYADNAQYWLGEAYKVNQETASAKIAFTKVVTDYAKSPKVPDALLKLGYIELEQNNIAKARDYLTQITVSHPETTAAHLASKKLQQMTLAQP